MLRVMLHEEDNTTAFPLQRASTKSLAECLVEVARPLGTRLSSTAGWSKPPLA